MLPLKQTVLTDVLIMLKIARMGRLEVLGVGWKHEMGLNKDVGMQWLYNVDLILMQ